MNQTTPTPQFVASQGVPMHQPVPQKLAATTALTSVDAVGSISLIPSVQAPQTIAPVTQATDAVAPTSVREVATATDGRDDTALLVGLSLWTARQHERYLARTAAAEKDVVPHRYPTVLTDTLRRHADAGDPTCRLVLNWLLAKGIAETGSTSREGAV